MKASVTDSRTLRKIQAAISDYNELKRQWDQLIRGNEQFTAAVERFFAEVSPTENGDVVVHADYVIPVAGSVLTLRKGASRAEVRSGLETIRAELDRLDKERDEYSKALDAKYHYIRSLGKKGGWLNE